MTEKNISQEFRSKEIDKARNYFNGEIKQNELISKKRKMFCKILNYSENLLILASTVTGCVSISTLNSLVGIPVGIASFAITIKIFVITAELKSRISNF